MGFYLRKSVSVGPLRFNLSKSGIGLSAGVRGLRIGSGPRGNYVHMGRGGLYYRTSLSGAPSRAPSASMSPPPAVDASGMQEIESGSILEMVDAPSAVLIEEMNQKRKAWRLWPWIAILGFFVIGRIADGDPIVTLSAVAVFIGLVWLTAQWDRLRLTTVLMYDLEEQVVKRYQQLHDAFDQLMRSGRVGHIGAQGAVTDTKRHAGANKIVRRKVIRPHKQPPKRVTTNIEVPAIPVGRQTLHFFPDRILVVDALGVGAVSYNELTITASATRFIEDESVPSDAKVVGQTWKYVNKKGGPDRRFRDNRELPIALYEEIHFSSGSGLNEVIQVSRTGIGELLNTARNALITPAEPPNPVAPATNGQMI